MQLSKHISKWNTLASNHNAMMLSKTENGRVDYIVYRFCPGNVVEVVDIAVNSERGVGKGTFMMRELEDIARHGNAYLIFAFTRYDNDNAHRFYEKLGYTPLATLPGFYEGEDAIIFARKLL